MNWLNSLLRKPPQAPAARPAAPGKSTPGKTPAAAARVAAVAPPADVPALRAALAAAPDAAERAVREQALGVALGLASQAPAASDAIGVRLAAICHCADKALALQWLDGVDGDAVLGEIAGNARFAEIRLAAAQRITDGSVLEAVARASKNKDKGVYRHCADLLRTRRDAQDRQEQAEVIRAGLQALLDRAPLSVSHLLELERAWKALAEAAPAGIPAGAAANSPQDALTACAGLLAQANARILAEAEAQRVLLGLQGAVALASAELAGPAWPAPATLAQWHARQASLTEALAQLPDWLRNGAGGSALQRSLQAMASQLASLREDAERVAALEAYFQAVAAGSAGATGGASPPADTVAAAAPGGWDALPKPVHPEALQQVVQRWQGLRPACATAAAGHDAPAAEVPADSPPQDAAEPRSEAAAPQATAPSPLAPVDLEGLRTQLDQLEQALEAGQLAQGDAAARQIKAILGEQSPEGRLDARLQRALARLGELRGWAQWGATKKREDLIAAAGELRAAVAAGSHNVEHLLVAIPALREEWKRLNAQGPAGKGQWEQFDRALEQAYVPVAAFHAEEAERRKQARAAREALLAGWEAALAAIDWEHPDGAAIDAQREQMLAQWRAAPHAGFREERALRARFDALVRDLDQRVDTLRAAEVQRREGLIAAAAGLADLSDPRAATARAKELQEQWRTQASPLRLRRGEEQKLWQRFRAACDSVFARRDAERTAQQAAREQQQQARQARIDQFAAALAVDDPDALARALAGFRTDWDAGTDAVPATPGGPAAAQDRQARDLQRQAQERIGALRLAALQERYAALDRGRASGAGLSEADGARGAAVRADLLIDLEIALGLSTPGAGAELRRRRQLEQLQNRFRSGPAPAAREADPEKLLAQWYATPAPPDDSQEARVAAAAQALIERGRAALQRNATEAQRPSPRGAARAGTPGRRDPRGIGPRPGPRARA